MEGSNFTLTPFIVLVNKLTNEAHSVKCKIVTVGTEGSEVQLHSF
jgi:hypothetical protein